MQHIRPNQHQTPSKTWKNTNWVLAPTLATIATLASCLVPAPLEAGERPTLGLSQNNNAAQVAEEQQPVIPQQQDVPAELASDQDKKALRQELIQRFDSNGDGKLDETERQAMREALKKRLAEWRQRLPAEADADGDGTITKEEARTWFQSQKQAYDVDGDGSLNKEERQAFKQHLEELGLAGLVSWVGKQHKRPQLDGNTGNGQTRSGANNQRQGQNSQGPNSEGSQGGHHRRGPPPEADLNGDGTITREEGRQWHQQNVGKRGGQGKDKRGGPNNQNGPGGQGNQQPQGGPPPKRK